MMRVMHSCSVGGKEEERSRRGRSITRAVTTATEWLMTIGPRWSSHVKLSMSFLTRTEYLEVAHGTPQVCRLCHHSPLRLAMKVSLPWVVEEVVEMELFY